MARCYIVHNEKERNIREKSGNNEKNEHSWQQESERNTDSQEK